LKDNFTDFIRVAVACYPVHDNFCYCVLSVNRLIPCLKEDSGNQTE
jgi:hypothetical protein